MGLLDGGSYFIFPAAAGGIFHIRYMGTPMLLMGTPINSFLPPSSSFPFSPPSLFPFSPPFHNGEREGPDREDIVSSDATEDALQVVLVEYSSDSSLTLCGQYD